MFKYQVILCSFFGLCVAKQAKFTLCGFSGFSCSTIGDEPQTITYRCPSDQKDILLKINDFENPPNGVSLIIENCPEITVSFQCSSQVRYLQSLIIRSIGTLKIQQDPQYQTHLPLEVLLQNVTYIDEIPGFAFSQVNKVLHNVNCVRPEFDLKLLQFENVRIGTILANGIYMPKDAGNVVFSNVAIGRMKKDAILANMTISYIFQMEDSAVGMMENQAIQVSGKGMLFLKNALDEISSAGIKGLVEHFYFAENSVDILQPQGISVTAQTVLIWQNTFKDMKSGALEKISPGLLPDSLGGNFTYKFFLNRINRMEARSLHPDFEAYEMLPTKIHIKSNLVVCSCRNSGWLFSQTGQNQTPTAVERFYATFVAKNYRNSCSSSCRLPIADTKVMIRDGKCDENITVEELCLNQKT